MLAELHPGRARALLFDWDGTLVDSQAANHLAMDAALTPQGMRVDQDWFDARTGLSSADMIQALAAETGTRLTVPVEDLVAARDRHFLVNADRIRVHARVAEVALAYHGELPLAVASGGARPIIETTMRHLSLEWLFTALVTRDDVDRGKPAPDIFLRAAEALRTAPADCLVYEDSDEGIDAARAAGMPVIDVRPITRPRS